jgi:hypothetical protein
VGLIRKSGFGEQTMAGVTPMAASQVQVAGVMPMAASRVQVAVVQSGQERV